jgi:hypothetical protein
MKQEVKQEKVEEQIKPEQTAPNRIAAGYIGKYAISFAEKIYSFEFPVNNTLEENLALLTYLRDELIKAIVDKDKKEQERKEKESKEEIQQ